MNYRSLSRGRPWKTLASGALVVLLGLAVAVGTERAVAQAGPDGAPAGHAGPDGAQAGPGAEGGFNGGGAAGVAPAGPAVAQAGDTRSARAAARDFQEAFRTAAERVVPAVVEVNVVQVVNVRQQQSPFDFFFGPRRGQGDQRQFRQRGLGSGVIVRQEGDTGYAITNTHVIAEADEIELVLDDGRSFQAQVVGSDRRLDLALLSFDLDGEQVPVATFADSSELQVGDWVVAVGNPLGFDFTVTAGIISGLGRRPEQGELASSPTDYIQTDAAINRGNSGGALANLDGELVGINTWIASQSGGSIGLGFAIPSNVAMKAVNDFIEEGRIVYGWLGVTIGAANPNQFPNIRSDLGLGDASGALILNVYEGSPAATGGLQPGDFVTSMNNAPVQSVSQLSRRVASLSPNQTMEFTVIRYGQERSVSVRITGRPTEEQLQEQAQTLWPGAVIMNITDALRERLGIPFSVEGVLVSQVQDGSAAEDAGLQQGDVVERIGGRRVRSMQEFYRGLNEGGTRVPVRVNRGGDTVNMTLEQ
jgi:serine protease Do